MNENIATALCSAEFFRGLPRESCQRLAAVCRIKELRKRATLFLEASRGSAMFLLLEGRVCLSKAAPDGNEVVIRTLRPGDTFAEVTMFEQDRYPVTATAWSAARVACIAKSDILRLLENRPFRNDFIAMLMRKQRYLVERVRMLTTADVETRFFVFLREQYGEQASIRITLSKKDIAAAIGATPETLSRLIQRLRRKRLIQWKNGVLDIAPAAWERLDASVEA